MYQIKIGSGLYNADSSYVEKSSSTRGTNTKALNVELNNLSLCSKSLSIISQYIIILLKIVRIIFQVIYVFVTVSDQCKCNSANSIKCIC